MVDIVYVGCESKKEGVERWDERVGEKWRRNFFFFFKQKAAYEILSGLVGSEMWIRDRVWREKF